ncbi:hypothetical protein HYH02_007004 [Chlamydomonas schloesseri]|uniref:Uncharacterized protein n=1 Tax=Chlamydomonas schloesseri TaxID=2026947 RepID=A0A835WJD9_9CHLO|nr:hypothetical protein HYH02_007004 [Chlamydomonas schloesseri]|eukprot:KAG2447975.1 hypothetical protein HYH02_007004 [Chlamydomonas schloesseri]
MSWNYGSLQIAFAQSTFRVVNRRFTAYTQPATFLEAVATCSNTSWSQGESFLTGALLPTSLLGDVLTRLARDQPHTAQALWSALADVAAGGPAEQQQWALWAWEESRPCGAAKLLSAAAGSGNGSNSDGSGAVPLPDVTLVTTDRPCSWRLAYVCAEEQAVVLAAGLSSSSVWYRRHFAPGALEPLLPSPYTATRHVPSSGNDGDGLSSSNSSKAANLAFYRSGFVAGGLMEQVFWPNGSLYSARNEAVEPFPVAMEAEDGAERFWRLGPVVTALYRGGNRRLTALRLVREGEAAQAWAAYQGQSAEGGLPPPLGDEFVFGDRVPAFDAEQVMTAKAPFYDIYNVASTVEDTAVVEVRVGLREAELN